MDFNRLQSPVPRLSPNPVARAVIPVAGEPDYLPIPEFDASVPFIEVLTRRTTKRTFGSLSVEQLSALLWMIGKTIRAEGRPDNVWQHRYPPSAGGIHPVSLLVLSPSLGAAPLSSYCTISHALRTPAEVSEGDVSALRDRIEAVVPIGAGTAVLFAADFPMVISKYENGESLVWRDAGVLYGYAALAAEYLGLAFCGLGITEPPMRGLVGVGGFLVGTDPETESS